MYNIFFTQFPAALYALDKDLPESILLQYPHLYADTRKFINLRMFGLWLARALLQACMMMLFTVWVLGKPGFWTSNGMLFGIEAVSLTTYTALVMLQLLTVILESHTFTM